MTETSRHRTEICILAGGLSRRMGRDKAQLRLGGIPLLARIRQAAQATGLPAKVIRRDIVPRCGPLGGVYTALKRTRMDQVVFLASDMPLISTAIIEWLLEKAEETGRSKKSRGRAGLVEHSKLGPPQNAFICGNEGAGFPFLLHKSALQVVSEEIELGSLSLQHLARRLGAAALRPPPSLREQLKNVNTPADWAGLTGSARHRLAPSRGADPIRSGNSIRRSASSRS